MPQESPRLRKPAQVALMDFFQEAFKLFGVGQSPETTLDKSDGFLDGILLLPVRCVTGDRLMVHERKVTAHLSQNSRVKLSKTRQQRSKQHVGKI